MVGSNYATVHGSGGSDAFALHSAHLYAYGDAGNDRSGLGGVLWYSRCNCLSHLV